MGTSAVDLERSRTRAGGSCDSGRFSTPTPKEFGRATELIWERFPFQGFPNSMRGSEAIARLITRYVPLGSSILDFGSGTCVRAAFMALCGYEVWACDDLRDEWHLRDDNRQRIYSFAQQMGVRFSLIEADRRLPYRDSQFDVVMINDVIEHLHDSPFRILSEILTWVRPGGYLLISVPNAANLRKRVALLFGRTNYPPYDDYFWYPPPWRGHVREYVLNDLRLLNRFMGLDEVDLSDAHFWVDFRLKNRVTHRLYLALTSLLPWRGIRDTLILLARKPTEWKPASVDSRRRGLPPWAAS